MTYDILHALLRAPLNIDEFFAAVLELETLARGTEAGFWHEESTRAFDETMLAALLAKVRYYCLIVTAQHLLLREIRQELGKIEGLV